jgi:hypothetical protein
MIMDGLLIFDGTISAGVLTPVSVDSGTTFAVGATASTNVIDVSQIASSASGYGRDVGIGEDLEIFVGVHTAFSTGSSPTLTIDVATAPDNGSGGIGSYTVLAKSGVLAAATLVAGYEAFRIKVPAGVEKYIKLVYNVLVANFTSGALFAAIVLDREALGPLKGYRSAIDNTYL